MDARFWVTRAKLLGSCRNPAVPIVTHLRSPTRATRVTNMKTTIAILTTACLAACAQADQPKAKAVFEVLKQMQGTWSGQSKSGMKETLETKLIGGGAVLMETS